MLRITVELKQPGHFHDILLEPGLSQAWPGEIEERIPSDSYLAVVDAGLAAVAGMPPHGAEAGRWRYLWVGREAAGKDLGAFFRLCGTAFGMNLGRGAVIAGFGGGGVLDMAGFLAATAWGGLRHALVPTTLTAQIASSVGGECHLHVGGVRNALGLFRPPELVLVDPALLESLSMRTYISGLAEVVRTAIVGGREFFRELRLGRGLLLDRSHGFMAGVIAGCCRVRAGLTAGGERPPERGRSLRMGRSFGALLEALGDEDILHGEATAVGIRLAATLALERGVLPRGDFDDIRELMERLRLPTRIADLGGATPGAWRERLTGDRAARELLLTGNHDGERFGLVLPHGIGDCRFEPNFTVEEVLDFMRLHVEG